MPLSPSQRLASIEDLLLYRLGRLASVGGAMVVRLCEGGYGITRREWAVIGQLYEGGSLPLRCWPNACTATAPAPRGP